MTDVGLEALEFVQSTMQIDNAWSVRESRQLTWWSHRLAQRIVTEPGRTSHGVEVFRVSAETDLLRNVASSGRTAERLAVFNDHASMSAFVWNVEAGTIRLRCSAGVHAETAGTANRLFAAAASIQVADAHLKVDGLAELLGGEPDISEHPTAGTRRTGDDMLEIIAGLYAPEGANGPPFNDADFQRAAVLKTRLPWAEVVCEGASLRALIDCGHRRDRQALLFMTSTQRHPQLGAGLLMIVEVPVPLNLSDLQLISLAHELNSAEAGAWQIPYSFGAWRRAPRSKDSVAYAAFFPRLVCRPGMIEAMALQLTARAEWAVETIDDGIKDVRQQAAAVRSNQEYTAPALAVRRALAYGLQGPALDRIREVVNNIRERTQKPASHPRCWSCKAELPFSEATRGQKVRCPGCGKKQELPR
jgi:hypothetical protein